MTDARKFNPAHIAKLNDPKRLEMIDPAVVWRELGAERPAAVADIGAGTGVFAVSFARHLAPGGKIWACDVEKVMVEWMREHLVAALRDAVIPLLVEESRVGLPDASLDLAYMITVYHELERPAESLRDVRRMLRPGGILGIVDWRKKPMLEGPPLAHRVSAEEIRFDMERAGFAGSRISEPLPLHSIVVGRKP